MEFTGLKELRIPEGKVKKIEANGKVLWRKNVYPLTGWVKGRVDNGVIGYPEGTYELVVENGIITMTTFVQYRGVVSPPIKVKPNTDYLLRYTSTLQTVVPFIDAYDSDLRWVSRIGSNLATFNSASAQYIRISYQNFQTGTATIKDGVLIEL